MKLLTFSYINSLCAKCERVADKSIKMKHFNKSLRFLKVLCFIRYKFHLGYKDDFIENQIMNLAQHIEKKIFTVSPDEKTIVIIDEINADYVGLMTQYLAPFITSGYQILYIYEQIEHKGDVRTNLMQTLYSYENAQLKEIPAYKKIFEKSQWIYDEVCAFGSKKVLMNFGEWAVEHCVACYALPKECIKYHINAGDHCFWAGACCADYSFELRHYGANLSFKERGLSKGQIVYQPFYPVMKEVPFLGLPSECEDKFIFLSGGAAYKVVDDEKTFFRLCKEVLNRCPDSIVLYAGANTGNIDNVVLQDGIEQFGLQGRFISIGYRNDILEVFRHCDVFFDTFPIGGGTMCQFAAQCSKPIINYLYPGVEECVAQKKECHFTYYTEEDLIEEAVKLYSDDEYRKNRGVAMHASVVSKDEFDKALLSFMSTNEPVYEVKWDDNFVPRTLSTEDAIKYNNKALFVFYYQLLRYLRCYMLLIMPSNFFSLCISGIKRKMKKVIKFKYI